jgi:hypothetical protein
MSTIRTAARHAVLVLICAGLVVAAANGGASAADDGPLPAPSGQPTSSADPTSPGPSSPGEIECEDLTTGEITPGPCPYPPGDGQIVYGNGEPAPGEPEPSARPVPAPDPGLIAAPVSTAMTLKITPDRLRLGDAGSDTFVLNAPRTVSVGVKEGGSFYRRAGRGNTLMETRVGDRQARTISFTSNNVSNCTAPALAGGPGATLYSGNQIPRGFAVVTQFPNIGEVTLSFTCDVS